MHTKLNFKIHGVLAADGRELLADNLKFHDGIHSLKFFLNKKDTMVKMEIDSHKISKQQVLDILKISGDFDISEQSGTEAEPGAGSNPLPTANSARTSFALGLLAGLGVISLAVNILLGYFFFKSDSASIFGSRNSAANDIWAPSPSPTPSPAPQVQGAAAPIQNFDITKDDHVRGDFDALITLVEYSDFECPFCERHYPTLKKILSDYEGQVKLVYKHFPLGFHPNAQKAAEASE